MASFQTFERAVSLKIVSLHVSCFPHRKILSFFILDMHISSISGQTGKDVAMWYGILKTFAIFANARNNLLASTFASLLNLSFYLHCYSRVPNNRPLPIVNFSIFLHPGHLYSNLPPSPRIINF